MGGDASEGKARLALVTGGHRRLGAVIASALARAGYQLAIHGSHDVKLDPQLQQVLADTGVAWQGFVADFTDPAEAARLIPEICDSFGHAPSLLVNSAAIFGQDRLATVTADDLARHYAVNCMAPVLLTQGFAAAVGHDVGKDRCIINILDQRLAHPHGDQLSYTLAKQALSGFTQITARSLAPAIRVNAVAPGLTIATHDYDEAQMERLAGMMPLHRLPQPEQVAQAVLYLAEAKAVTGQVIAVDGGAHMRSFDRDFMHM